MNCDDVGTVIATWLRRCRHGDSNSDCGNPSAAVLRDGFRDTSSAVVAQVHRTVCQVLYHRCHRARGRSARGTSSCCDAGARLLCPGRCSPGCLRLSA